MTSVFEAENSSVSTKKDTPYLGVAGELWGVFCEKLE